MAREAGFYWVCLFGSDEPVVASWSPNIRYDGTEGDMEWNFCGAESVGYAESDDPTEDRVRVVSERLIPPKGK